MPLSNTAKALLDVCARAIADKTSVDIDLYGLNSEHHSWFDETPAYLAERVEEYSGRQFTVRHADVALFARHVKGINLYLVRCAYSTPTGKVTELTNDMVLVSFGPYGNGFKVSAAVASPEDRDRYRAFVAKGNQERLVRQNAAENATMFLDALTRALAPRVAACQDPETRAELERLLRIYSLMPLEKIAEVCQKLDITLQDLAQEAFA